MQKITVFQHPVTGVNFVSFETRTLFDGRILHRGVQDTSKGDFLKCERQLRGFEVYKSFNVSNKLIYRLAAQYFKIATENESQLSWESLFSDEVINYYFE